MVSICSCSRCKEYRSYSPTRHHDIPPPPSISKHHMDGASASSGGGLPARLSSGSHTPPRVCSTNGSTSVSPLPTLNAPHRLSQQGVRGDEDCDMSNSSSAQSTKTTTLKLKLPDLRKGGSKIQISLEVGDIVYEGVICASSPTSTLMNNDLLEEEPRESTGH